MNRKIIVIWIVIFSTIIFMFNIINDSVYYPEINGYIFVINDTSDNIFSCKELIRGDPSFPVGGILYENSRNVTITDCDLTGFHTSIKFSNMADSIIRNVKISDNKIKGGVGILIVDSRNIMIDNVEISGIGSGYGLTGYGIKFSNTNNSNISNFNINDVTDICILPNGYNNTVTLGNLWDCGRALASSFPGSQGNIFENITVHYMKYSSPGIFRSVISLGEGTGSIYPHVFRNNVFSNAGKNGGSVDFIEDVGYHGIKPDATFSGNYWRGNALKYYIIQCESRNGNGCDGFYYDSEAKNWNV